jgi:hypothetical protein
MKKHFDAASFAGTKSMRRLVNDGMTNAETLQLLEFSTRPFWVCALGTLSEFGIEELGVRCLIGEEMWRWI